MFGFIVYGLLAVVNFWFAGLAASQHSFGFWAFLNLAGGLLCTYWALEEAWKSYSAH